MPQHFKAIGFDVPDAHALKKLAHQAIANGEAILSNRSGLPEGLFVWDLGRGLHVLVAARRVENEEWEIVSCQPGFLSDDVTTLRAYRIAANREREGEALIRGLLPGGAKLEAALLNLACNDRLPLSGADLSLHLSGLALEANVYAENERPVLHIGDGDGEPRPVDSVFAAVDSDSHCMLVGDITRVREVVNFHTGEKLFALGLKTADIEISTLAPQRFFSAAPLPGRIMQALVWLQAQLPQTAV